LSGGAGAFHERMKRIEPQPDWPESWQRSFLYDEMEVYGSRHDPGYSYAYATRAKETFRLVQSVAAPGARVLDVAAAQGNFSLRLAEMGYNVTWNDLRAELADYVRLKHESGALTYRAGNAFELNLEQPFDIVLITEIIEHVAYPDDFLIKAAQLVRPGGYIIMTTPNGAYFRNPLPKFSATADPSIYEAGQFKPDADGHIFLLHQEEIPVLAKAAELEVCEVRLSINPLLKGALRLNVLLPWMPEVLVQFIESVAHRLPAKLQNALFMQMVVLLKKPAFEARESMPGSFPAITQV